MTRNPNAYVRFSASDRTMLAYERPVKPTLTFTWESPEAEASSYHVAMVALVVLANRNGFQGFGRIGVLLVDPQRMRLLRILFVVVAHGGPHSVQIRCPKKTARQSAVTRAAWPHHAHS